MMNESYEGKEIPPDVRLYLETIVDLRVENPMIDERPIGTYVEPIVDGISNGSNPILLRALNEYGSKPNRTQDEILRNFVKRKTLNMIAGESVLDS